ncbi:uncharacterized protein JN550_003193 [Neoarthrinium moseri]|uniref:uncharacterized protein n=1 Tax=Neoarthrinium moseri TaxID=1658444 RepID=UPI001FDB9FE0|nr:uncharacterized protein JN550_003193 [Neoarthrinium moseri]KAI1873924.1 hypothetical protein JN550_003193 [Neoarthrinium moseri]
MASEGPVLIQWIVDTRSLWPEATKTAQLEDVAPQYLALLTPEERTGVLKYYFVRDAKMSLASQLLKHYVVSKTQGIPWASTKLTRDSHKKPIYLSPSGEQPVYFNVSHQAGIVALTAVTDYPAGFGPVDVGVDVVCVNERADRDHKMIQTQGWGTFVDMHADVFGRSEAADLKDVSLAGQPRHIIDANLRKFYALWCLREAYVKMTGEALLAEWLNDLEFKSLRAPVPALNEVQTAGDAQDTIIREHEVLFKGKKVDDANICLRSLGKDYMTCTAVRTPKAKDDALRWDFGPFETIDISIILEHAETMGSLQGSGL